MFELLTAFISGLEKGDFGGWTKQTGDGTPEKPYVFCHVEYSEPVRGLLSALSDFWKANKDELRLSPIPDVIDEIEEIRTQLRRRAFR